jgi:RNA ligase
MEDTVHLHQLIDPALLHDMLSARYIRRVEHPTGCATLYNYTDAAQYDQVWNAATLACRGLIVDSHGTVIARPWAKFFNYAELDSFPDGPVEVTDKLDGSLGIIHRDPDTAEPVIATRGSFSSEQAQHGTEILRTRYRDFNPGPATTYLVEIIYPQNRIVCDYDGLDDLVLLGAVDIATGVDVRLCEAAETWPGPVVHVFPYTAISEAASASDRPGREGVVVHHLATGTRTKLKQADYVHLHKLISGLSTTMVWDHLASGAGIDELVGRVPDEFYPWIKAVSNDLIDEYQRFERELQDLHADLIARVATIADGREQRRTYAGLALASGHRLAHSLFRLYDGRSIDAEVWDAVKPSHATASRTGD